VAGALFDFERVVTTDGAPRDAGRAEIVEGDRLARRVVHREELGALHAGEREAAAKLARRGA
jgi:hypothetical protein